MKEEIGIMRRLANPNVIKFVDAFENSREIILGRALPVFYFRGNPQRKNYYYSMAF